MTQAFSYWNTKTDTPGLLAGVYPMGGGGKLEVLYRHFFETKHFFNIVKLDKNTRILELGSGNGRWALAFSSRVASYVGVDFSKNLINYARKEIVKRKIRNVKFVLSPIEKLKIAGCFDIIYFSGVAQYLKDKDLLKVIKKLKVNLSPDGVIVDRSTINLFKTEIVNENKYFSIYRTAQDLTRLFKFAGYKNIYQKRSYRFLRGYKILNNQLSSDRVIKIVISLSPYSFYLLYIMTVISDFLFPIAFENGERSHDLFLFKKK